MKFLAFFTEMIYWLWLFVIPAGIGFAAGFLLYHNSTENLVYAIITTAAGVAGGVLLAEYVRKKHGLSAFFGRLLSMPEMEKKEQD